MQTLFEYNWQVREDWYKWCEDVPEEELLRDRTGGVGGILHSLFHIIDVEWSWIRIVQGKPDFQEKFENYRSLERVRALDSTFKPEVVNFVRNWDSRMENRIIQNNLADGTIETLRWGEVVRHVIAHEIHHMGQLSVWSRELGKKPVTANLLWRDLGVSK
ncbi:DinB family protein [Bacillus oleivorans]|uniref:DinB family protein n=1 Tax=Bacillus oleivorans TaxID=1448271 RepID=UPI000BE2CA4E|nr:DinB family protein [Bacillus oleivorans]